MNKFVMVLLLSLVGCGTVTPNDPVNMNMSGVGGSAGDFQGLGGTGGIGNSAGGSTLPDGGTYICTQADYENSLVGTWNGGGISYRVDLRPIKGETVDCNMNELESYAQLRFVRNVKFDTTVDYLYVAVLSMANSYGNTMEGGTWGLSIGNINLMWFNAPNSCINAMGESLNPKVQVQVNTVTCKVFIPGYVKQ